MKGQDLAEAMTTAMDRVVSARCRENARVRVERGGSAGDLNRGEDERSGDNSKHPTEQRRTEPRRTEKQ